MEKCMKNSSESPVHGFVTRSKVFFGAGGCTSDLGICKRIEMVPHGTSAWTFIQAHFKRNRCFRKKFKVKIQQCHKTRTPGSLCFFVVTIYLSTGGLDRKKHECSSVQEATGYTRNQIVNAIACESLTQHYEFPKQVLSPMLGPLLCRRNGTVATARSHRLTTRLQWRSGAPVPLAKGCKRFVAMSQLVAIHCHLPLKVKLNFCGRI